MAWLAQRRRDMRPGARRGEVSCGLARAAWMCLDGDSTEIIRCSLDRAHKLQHGVRANVTRAHLDGYEP